jgi:hypothetical protein
MPLPAVGVTDPSPIAEKVNTIELALDEIMFVKPYTDATLLATTPLNILEVAELVS